MNIIGTINIPSHRFGKELLQNLGCTIFIDDKYLTFKECNQNGIFCLLMDAPHNRHIKTEYRIYDLNINTIIELWDRLR